MNKNGRWPLHFTLLSNEIWTWARSWLVGVLVGYTWQTGIDELCNILKYIIYGFLIKSTHLLWLLMKKSLKYCLVNFFPSVDPLTEKSIVYRLWLERLWFLNRCGISVSRAKRTQPIATPQIDRYVKINRNFQTFERLVTVLYTLSC